MHGQADQLAMFVRRRLSTAESSAQAEDAELILQLGELSQRPQDYDAPNRRSVPRIPTDASALMRIISPFSPDRLAARVLDVSIKGLRIHSDSLLSLGTIVQLQIGTLHVLGEVRYYIAADSGVYAGILIQDIQ